MCTQSIEFACLHYIFHPAGGCASVRRGSVRIWNKKEGSNKGSRPYCRTPYWGWSKLYLLLEKNAWNLNANARSQSSTFHRRQGARTVWIKVENHSNFIFYFHYPSFFSYHTFYVGFSSTFFTHTALVCRICHFHVLLVVAYFPDGPRPSWSFYRPLNVCCAEKVSRVGWCMVALVWCRKKRTKWWRSNEERIRIASKCEGTAVWGTLARRKLDKELVRTDPERVCVRGWRKVVFRSHGSCPDSDRGCCKTLYCLAIPSTRIRQLLLKALLIW